MSNIDIFSDFHDDSCITQPYIIAEAGVNHEGSIDIAKRLIDEAQEGGADAIKFQSYKAETLASKNSPAYWDTKKEPTKSQYELFKRHDSFWKKEFEELKTYCDKVGIKFLSTPFDVESAKFLDPLMDIYKISSSDITNKPFIEILCSFNKPILLSTGASYLHEIIEAVEWIEERGNKLALLHCVLNYPTKDINASLGMIKALKHYFPKHIIGYSDHTLPTEDMHILEYATLLGAKIIEKHFTHDKTLQGNDHYHAMDKNDLKNFRKRIDHTISCIGPFKIYSLPDEEPARKHARRSLVAKRLIPAGKIIEFDDLTWKRPAHGISPKYYTEIIGKKARYNINEDSILSWTDLE